MLDELGERSRWMMRAMEWDDTRARYPNLWHEGMPCQVLALEKVVSRLRLGDLIAVYYPASQRHPDRSRRFLGLSRVCGLRRSHRPGTAWIDLETAHRFATPLDLKQQPRRVFMCCDTGWPEQDVALFRKVFDAAVAEGWRPATEERERPAAEPAAEGKPAGPAAAEPAAQGSEEPAAPTPEPAVERSGALERPAPELPSDMRLFGGVDYGGDMRDPRQGTWLAIVGLLEGRLHVTRLEATGRSGLQRYLRDPDRTLMNVEAIGLDFPFGLPLPFAESLLGGSFPDEGWWALVKRLERLSRPRYLIALQEFRDAHGELKRLTDEKADVSSPLHRLGRDLGPLAFHGIRMIAEDRSRYAVRPFETAQGKLLLEVSPSTALRRLVGEAASADEAPAPSKLMAALRALEKYPVELEEQFRRICGGSRRALHAVIAARCAALAVLTGEADRSPDDLVAGEGARLRREGWIYGLEETA